MENHGAQQSWIHAQGRVMASQQPSTVSVATMAPSRKPIGYAPSTYPQQLQANHSVVTRRSVSSVSSGSISSFPGLSNPVSSPQTVRTVSEPSAAQLAVQQQLPMGWIFCYDQHGRTYYYNTANNTSCWDKPDRDVYGRLPVQQTTPPVVSPAGAWSPSSVSIPAPVTTTRAISQPSNPPLQYSTVPAMRNVSQPSNLPSQYSTIPATRNVSQPSNPPSHHSTAAQYPPSVTRDVSQPSNLPSQYSMLPVRRKVSQSSNPPSQRSPVTHYPTVIKDAPSHSNPTSTYSPLSQSRHSVTSNVSLPSNEGSGYFPPMQSPQPSTVTFSQPFTQNSGFSPTTQSLPQSPLSPNTQGPTQGLMKGPVQGSQGAQGEQGIQWEQSARKKSKFSIDSLKPSAATKSSFSKGTKNAAEMGLKGAKVAAKAVVKNRKAIGAGMKIANVVLKNTTGVSFGAFIGDSDGEGVVNALGSLVGGDGDGDGASAALDMIGGGDSAGGDTMDSLTVDSGAADIDVEISEMEVSDEDVLLEEEDVQVSVQESDMEVYSQQQVVQQIYIPPTQPITMEPRPRRKKKHRNPQPQQREVAPDARPKKREGKSRPPRQQEPQAVPPIIKKKPRQQMAPIKTTNLQANPNIATTIGIHPNKTSQVHTIEVKPRKISEQKRRTSNQQPIQTNVQLQSPKPKKSQKQRKISSKAAKTAGLVTAGAVAGIGAFAVRKGIKSMLVDDGYDSNSDEESESSEEEEEEYDSEDVESSEELDYSEDNGDYGTESYDEEDIGIQTSGAIQPLAVPQSTRASFVIEDFPILEEQTGPVGQQGTGATGYSFEQSYVVETPAYIETPYIEASSYDATPCVETPAYIEEAPILEQQVAAVMQQELATTSYVIETPASINCNSEGIAITTQTETISVQENAQAPQQEVSVVTEPVYIQEVGTIIHGETIIDGDVVYTQDNNQSIQQDISIEAEPIYIQEATQSLQQQSVIEPPSTYSQENPQIIQQNTSIEAEIIYTQDVSQSFQPAEPPISSDFQSCQEDLYEQTFSSWNNESYTEPNPWAEMEENVWASDYSLAQEQFLSTNTNVVQSMSSQQVVEEVSFEIEPHSIPPEPSSQDQNQLDGINTTVAEPIVNQQVTEQASLAVEPYSIPPEPSSQEIYLETESYGVVSEETNEEAAIIVQASTGADIAFTENSVSAGNYQVISEEIIVTAQDDQLIASGTASQPTNTGITSQAPTEQASFSIRSYFKIELPTPESSILQQPQAAYSEIQGEVNTGGVDNSRLSGQTSSNTATSAQITTSQQQPSQVSFSIESCTDTYSTPSENFVPQQPSPMSTLSSQKTNYATMEEVQVLETVNNQGNGTCQIVISQEPTEQTSFSTEPHFEMEVASETLIQQEPPVIATQELEEINPPVQVQAPKPMVPVHESNARENLTSQQPPEQASFAIEPHFEMKVAASGHAMQEELSAVTVQPLEEASLPVQAQTQSVVNPVHESKVSESLTTQPLNEPMSFSIECYTEVNDTFTENNTQEQSLVNPSSTADETIFLIQNEVGESAMSVNPPPATQEQIMSFEMSSGTDVTEPSPILSISTPQSIQPANPVIHTNSTESKIELPEAPYPQPVRPSSSISIQTPTKPPNCWNIVDSNDTTVSPITEQFQLLLQTPYVDPPATTNPAIQTLHQHTVSESVVDEHFIAIETESHNVDQVSNPDSNHYQSTHPEIETKLSTPNQYCVDQTGPSPNTLNYFQHLYSPYTPYRPLSPAVRLQQASRPSSTFIPTSKPPPTSLSPQFHQHKLHLNTYTQHPGTYSPYRPQKTHSRPHSASSPPAILTIQNPNLAVQKVAQSATATVKPSASIYFPPPPPNPPPQRIQIDTLEEKVTSTINTSSFPPPPTKVPRPDSESHQPQAHGQQSSPETSSTINPFPSSLPRPPRPHSAIQTQIPQHIPSPETYTPFPSPPAPTRTPLSAFIPTPLPSPSPPPTIQAIPNKTNQTIPPHPHPLQSSPASTTPTIPPPAQFHEAPTKTGQEPVELDAHVTEAGDGGDEEPITAEEQLLLATLSIGDFMGDSYSFGFGGFSDLEAVDVERGENCTERGRNPLPEVRMRG